MGNENYEALLDFIITDKDIVVNGHERISAGFGRGQVFFLIRLYHDKSVSATDLAEAMNVGSARVAYFLKDMEGRGLIQRTKDPDDHRRIIIVLTPQGIKVAKRLEKQLRDFADVFVSLYGYDSILQVNALLHKAADILNHMRGNA
jgi:DNA-binding MarR family transcriptional regulator